MSTKGKWQFTAAVLHARRRRARLFRCLALEVNSPQEAARMIERLRKASPLPAIDDQKTVGDYPTRD